MKVKKIFNEVYVGFIHFTLMLFVPIMWMLYMDEGSDVIRYLFPLTLISLMLILAKDIGKLLFKNKKNISNKDSIKK